MRAFISSRNFLNASSRSPMRPRPPRSARRGCAALRVDCTLLNRMRRTRILATLGPASNDPVTIRALLDAGVDAVRLNFSHGTADQHRETCARVRAAAADAG